MRRRRTRYNWLPNTGTIGPSADVEDTTAGRDFGAVPIAANGTTSVAIVDLLDDESSEDIGTAQTMAAALQSEYVIKRIVGKFFAAVEQSANNRPKQALVGLGIFVARAEDPDSAAGNFVPIGALTQAQAVDNYSPLRQETIREPWIFRRTWILQNSLATGQLQDINYPQSTVNYGSVQDGPHIDAKTGRRVGTDDRLWAIMAVRSYPINQPNELAGSVIGFLDYRVLGAPRRAKNRSAF